MPRLRGVVRGCRSSPDVQHHHEADETQAEHQHGRRANPKPRRVVRHQLQEIAAAANPSRAAGTARRRGSPPPRGRGARASATRGPGRAALCLLCQARLRTERERQRDLVEGDGWAGRGGEAGGQREVGQAVGGTGGGARTMVLRGCEVVGEERAVASVVCCKRFSLSFAASALGGLKTGLQDFLVGFFDSYFGLAVRELPRSLSVYRYNK